MSQIVDDLLTKRKHKLDDEDVRYFRDNPDKLDLIDNRETFNTWGLLRALVLAIIFVAGSKALAEVYADAIEQFLNDVVVDLVFEMGAALIGAVATVMFIEHQKSKQFRENLRLRFEIERRIEELDGAKG